jgi:hypothetical protein
MGSTWRNTMWFRNFGPWLITSQLAMVNGKLTMKYMVVMK